jgi:hypothetical protein
MAPQGKKKLILMPSPSMDKNKKEARNEHSLVRMPANVRKLLDFHEDKVEVWTAQTAEDRAASVLLDIFQAFSADIKRVKEMVQRGELKQSEAGRIGFVTTKMYNRITGGDDNKNIWVSTGVHDTVVGADPEFLLFTKEGDVVHANSIMSKSGIIGSDGAMAEVRPKPSTSPDGLINHIKQAFLDKTLTNAISQYDWKAGCYYQNSMRDYTMGGHIHVGNPAKVARMPLNQREMFFNVLNKIMDELVAIPCIRLDGEMGRKRRTECQIHSGGGGFGWFGEWRTCNGRLEHRSLSGMWLMHPSVAKCVIGTAKAITDAVFKYWAQNNFDLEYIIPKKYQGYTRHKLNHSSFSDWNKFKVCKDMSTIMSSAELRDRLNHSKGGDITTKWLNSWHSKMKGLETYGKYSKYIRGLKEILRINMNEVSNWDRTIQNNWLKTKKFLVDV